MEKTQAGFAEGAQKENAITFVHRGQKSEQEPEGEKTDVQQQNLLDMEEAADIGRIISLEGNTKARDSEAYARWIKIYNLKEQAKTFNFMSSHGLLSGVELDEEYERLTKQFRESRTQMKTTESQLKEVNRQLRLIGQYLKGKSVYREYYWGGRKTSFQKEHRAELELYDSTAKELREIFGEEKLPGIQELKAKKAALKEQKGQQYEEFKDVRAQ